MKKILFDSKGKFSGPIMVLLVLLLISILLVIISQFRGSRFFLADYAGIRVKKLELISRMQINLLRSVEAEKMAVGADTDESSKAFADQSQQKSDAVERDRQELGLLIKKDPTDREVDLLKEFDRYWVEFRSIDREILGFAVRNTNLKAADLSFSQGAAAMEKLEKALRDLMPKNISVQGNDQKIEKTAYEDIIAGLKILNLQAPHIASASNQEMDRIESEININKNQVLQSWKELKSIIPQNRQGALQKARSDFEDFMKVTDRVIYLSRQNTNIKSFELSLGRKRKITAECDEILNSLEEAVQDQSFKATR